MFGGGYRYVDLSEIKDSVEYECGVDAVVYDEHGNEHIVTHKGVATHPNDKAMSYIAEAIFNRLEAE